MLAAPPGAARARRVLRARTPRPPARPSRLRRRLELGGDAPRHRRRPGRGSYAGDNPLPAGPRGGRAASPARSRTGWTTRRLAAAGIMRPTARASTPSRSSTRPPPTAWVDAELSCVVVRRGRDARVPRAEQGAPSTRTRSAPACADALTDEQVRAALVDLLVRATYTSPARRCDLDRRARPACAQDLVADPIRPTATVVMTRARSKRVGPAAAHLAAGAGPTRRANGDGDEHRERPVRRTARAPRRPGR